MSEPSTLPWQLTVEDIADHLQTLPWNISRELRLGEQGQRGRLQGVKLTGRPGLTGQGGQWRIEPQAYLQWLRNRGAELPEQDWLSHPSHLPNLHSEIDLSIELRLGPEQMRQQIKRSRCGYFRFGRRFYLSDAQRQRLLAWRKRTEL